LIENGCSLSSVQSLLGHKSPETTMVYVHAANIRRMDVKSPLTSCNRVLAPRTTETFK